MILLVVNVRKNKKDTPIFVVMPDIYTREQILDVIHLGYTESDIDAHLHDDIEIKIQELGTVNSEILEEYDVGTYEAFFPDQWHGMY